MATQSSADWSNLDPAELLFPGAGVCFKGRITLNGKYYKQGQELRELCDELGLRHRDDVSDQHCDILVADHLVSTTKKIHQAARFGKPIISALSFEKWINSPKALEGHSEDNIADDVSTPIAVKPKQAAEPESPPKRKELLHREKVPQADEIKVSDLEPKSRTNWMGRTKTFLGAAALIFGLAVASASVFDAPSYSYYMFVFALLYFGVGVISFVANFVSGLSSKIDEADLEIEDRRDFASIESEEKSVGSVRDFFTAGRRAGGSPERTSAPTKKAEVKQTVDKDEKQIGYAWIKQVRRED